MWPRHGEAGLRDANAGRSGAWGRRQQCAALRQDGTILVNRIAARSGRLIMTMQMAPGSDSLDTTARPFREPYQRGPGHRYWLGVKGPPVDAMAPRRKIRDVRAPNRSDTPQGACRGRRHQLPVTIERRQQMLRCPRSPTRLPSGPQGELTGGVQIDAKADRTDLRPQDKQTHIRSYQKRSKVRCDMVR